MRKAILLIAILFCMITSYAQDTKPTKQETMDWLAGKMKQYLDNKYSLVGGNSKRYFDSYSNGKFIYEVISMADDGETRCGFFKITIHLDRITKINSKLSIYKDRQDNITETFERLTASGYNIITKDYTNFYKTRCEYDDKPENEVIFGKWDDGDTESNGAIFRFDLESGLRERAINALHNLIQYNTGGSEKKEVY